MIVSVPNIELILFCNLYLDFLKLKNNFIKDHKTLALFDWAPILLGNQNLEQMIYKCAGNAYGNINY